MLKIYVHFSQRSQHLEHSINKSTSQILIKGTIHLTFKGLHSNHLKHERGQTDI